MLERSKSEMEADEVMPVGLSFAYLKGSFYTLEQVLARPAPATDLHRARVQLSEALSAFQDSVKYHSGTLLTRRLERNATEIFIESPAMLDTASRLLSSLMKSQ